jgi:hypothetical protein
MMSYEAEKNLMSQMDKILESNPDFWDQQKYWTQCRDLVEKEYPDLELMEQASLIGTMMQERFPS